MEFNLTDANYLIAAICVITGALAFYTIGVWGERVQGKLKFWHIIFFLFGLMCDTVGVGLMKSITHMAIRHEEVHMLTGVIAILLMLIHSMWAIWTYTKGSPAEKARFNRYSIWLWGVWLVPYFIGMYLGMSIHS